MAYSSMVRQTNGKFHLRRGVGGGRRRLKKSIMPWSTIGRCLTMAVGARRRGTTVYACSRRQKSAKKSSCRIKCRVRNEIQFRVPGLKLRALVVLCREEICSKENHSALSRCFFSRHYQPCSLHQLVSLPQGPDRSA